jgi:hypothetical protein
MISNDFSVNDREDFAARAMPRFIFQAPFNQHPLPRKRSVTNRNEMTLRATGRCRSRQKLQRDA